MREELSRTRVDGFLDVRGKDIVNGKGQKILLSGWGLGNWLLCEGYMWQSHDMKEFDRPWKIEKIIRELTGDAYAADFWKKYRDTYVTEVDLQYMAELGYNSVRIPVSWKVLMEEGTDELCFKEEGFQLLDRVIDWCEKYKLYAILDLHAAPGGQTGANIDDSRDDIPELFTEQRFFDMGIALWKKIAKRYKDRWIVGGYDLLNEPIRPQRNANDSNVDYLVPKLQKFYECAIAAIRSVDRKHLVTLEGQHWAAETDIFDRRYDDRMVIDFHRYGCFPQKESFAKYITAAQRLDCPLWMGETGEGSLEWYTAMYTLSARLGIGYNLWTWKKMDGFNSPCSIRVPENWQLILNYAKGGKKPDRQKAQQILDQFLENIRIQNCDLHEEVTHAVFRQAGCSIRGMDYDWCAQDNKPEPCCYYPDRKQGYGFDSGWEKMALRLFKGSIVEYEVNRIFQGDSMSLKITAEEDTELEILQDGRKIGFCSLHAFAREDEGAMGSWEFHESKTSLIWIRVLSGQAVLDSVETFCG